MRDDEFAAVENIVADEPVEKLQHLIAKLVGLGLELVQRRLQPVRDRDVLAAQLAHELDIVVAGHAQRVAAFHHAHDEAQHAGTVRSAVNEVAQKHRLAAGRRRDQDIAVRLLYSVVELPQQCRQLVEATVDIADDVERSGLVAPVVPQLRARDACVLDVLGGLEHVDVPEALALE